MYVYPMYVKFDFLDCRLNAWGKWEHNFIISAWLIKAGMHSIVKFTRSCKLFHYVSK